MASLYATTTSADLLADAEAQAAGEGSLRLGGVESREDEDRIHVDEDAGGGVEGEQGQEGWVDVGDPRNEVGKRVKVYELRDASWFDRGTGHCKGVYDDQLDVALLVVEAEVTPKPEGEAADADEDEPGGFLKEGEGEPQLLLRSRVEKGDCYTKQQDTLIVWTEPTGVDIALSFQDAEGCGDIWAFITEVQRHLNNMPDDMGNLPSSSSPLATSPMLGSLGGMGMNDQRAVWSPPNLSNIREQESWLRSQAKSAVARERAVEHIIGDDFIKQLINVLHQAEDLESIEDLHALCSLMHTIILLNDNGIFEYVLQDDVFMGVVGMLEYDPEFPTLKASYRQFLSENTRFRQVVEIKDEAIRTKIHQTYRLLYLKDVVLARVLDDPTFNILNSFVFFNQIDIINHIQNNDALLRDLFSGFREERDDKSDGDPGFVADGSGAGPVDERKRDVVLFLHQLMLMGKNVQVANRLQLYRNLLERGLLFVCEWAFRRQEQPLLHAGAEILTLAVEHDVGAVRMHVLKEEEQRKRTLVKEMVDLLITTNDLGLKSQMTDTLRTLLEIKTDTEAFSRPKEGPISENFVQYFYESCCVRLFEPVMELPDFKKVKNTPLHLSRETGALLHHLTELLSFCILQHSHRSQYYVLSNPISVRVATLLFAKEKSLRHAALKYIKACLKSNNHFMHRYVVKNDLIAPILDVLKAEGARDNMLTSACMDVFDMIRSQNIKPIINHIFDKHKARIDELAKKPTIAVFIRGLISRWEQNNEPPPTEPSGPSTSVVRSAEAEQEDYFNADSDEEIGPKPPSSPAPVAQPQQKRKRQRTLVGGMPPAKKTPPAEGGSLLGLDYDDGSDSDGSAGSSPRHTAGPMPPSPTGAEVTTGLAPSPMALDETSPTKSAEPIPAASEEELQEIEQKMKAKRMREEQDEEEEGLAGLMGGAGAKGKKPVPPKEEAGKKIKLSFGLAKKLS